MKIPLTELLKKSVTLPLPVNGKPYRPMTIEELNATRILTRHAANNLQGLVAALKIAEIALVNCVPIGESNPPLPAIRAAMIAAETVEVEQ